MSEITDQDGGGEKEVVNACGTPHYWCLDDNAMMVGAAWCITDSDPELSHGKLKRNKQCYESKADIALVLWDCIRNDMSHGNVYTTSMDCGNRTKKCTYEQKWAGATIDGCHDQLCTPLPGSSKTKDDCKAECNANRHACQLQSDECTYSACCQLAKQAGFIDPDQVMLSGVVPTIEELMYTCENSVVPGSEDVNCFKEMVKCVQQNRAYAGGCCQCTDGWAGWRCNKPLCYPNCEHGTCTTKNGCTCDEGWMGTRATTPSAARSATPPTASASSRTSASVSTATPGTPATSQSARRTA